MANLLGDSSKQARMMIWSTPRSVSTAFARSMSARGDTEVFFEPYLHCHLDDSAAQVSSALDKPGIVGNKYTYSYIRGLLNANYPEAKVLFVKGMVHGIPGYFDLVEQGYKHSFLIRHPRKMCCSFVRVNQKLRGPQHMLSPNDPTVVDFKDVYHVLEQFYHYVEKEFHQPSPPLIDADDLLVCPEKILPKYCGAMGIEYTPMMLQWKSVDKSDLHWHCTDVGPISERTPLRDAVLSNAMKGEGFGKAPDLTEDFALPEFLEELVERALIVYNRMYKFRIKP